MGQDDCLGIGWDLFGLVFFRAGLPFNRLDGNRSKVVVAMNDIEKKAAEDWIRQAQKIESWNDTKQIKFFEKALKIIPALWHEIEVLTEQLEIRKK